MANIIIFNSGSSSIKFAIINPSTGEQSLNGLAEKIGLADSCVHFKHNGEKITQSLNGGGYAVAFRTIFDYLKTHQLLDTVTGIGHRVVHGGNHFSTAALVSDTTMAIMRENIPLAPLHNPANIAGIECCQKALPHLPQMAVFDTAFHQSMSPTVYQYAIPQDLAQKHAIRKYGFHGTSHHYIALQTQKMLGLNRGANIINAHLGNGSSICAMVEGKSVDTSMGFTPLDGLIMGTRSGIIDAGIFDFLKQQENMDSTQVNQMLNKQSGLLGLCGHSDMREIEDLAQQGDPSAQQAIDSFCHRLAQFIASYMIYFKHLDALVFTGGIGENSDIIRANVIKRLSNIGFAIDGERNAACVRGKAGEIHAKNSHRIMVIPTNEEVMIAQQTQQLIDQGA